MAELGEAGLIARILDRIDRPGGDIVGGGDDTALVRHNGTSALLTTDALVEGVDFDLSYCSPSDVGWKAIAVNASDIAAMCGRPSWATISLGLSPHTAVATIDGFVGGMLEASRRWNIGLVGGDISRAAELWISVAMMGSVLAGAPVLRRGARVGDALCVTGSLGGAAAGLRLLEDEGARPRSDAASAVVARQLRPLARVEQAAALAPFPPSAMIDLSDGLATDLGRLLTASGAGCLVDPAAVPVDPAATELFAEAALGLALTGGEDFELLFTIASGTAEAALTAVRATGVACTRIGTITSGPAMVGDQPLASWEEAGWDHLRGR